MKWKLLYQTLSSGEVMCRTNLTLFNKMFSKSIWRETDLEHWVASLEQKLTHSELFICINYKTEYSYSIRLSLHIYTIQTCEKDTNWTNYLPKGGSCCWFTSIPFIQRELYLVLKFLSISTKYHWLACGFVKVRAIGYKNQTFNSNTTRNSLQKSDETFSLYNTYETCKDMTVNMFF